jgi:hypothetical protein
MAACAAIHANIHNEDEKTEGYLATKATTISCPRTLRCWVGLARDTRNTNLSTPLLLRLRLP